MKVAVTGAGGFIGRHVLPALQATGADVVAVMRPGSTLRAVAQGIEVVQLDLAGAGADAFSRIGRPDSMIHLAWGGLPHYQSSHHLDCELPLQQAFLETCVRSGLKHLVVTGTCFEYGLQSGELHENLPAQPYTVYGKAKDEVRRSLQRLQSQFDFGLSWLRIFYLYGPGQAATSLYSLLRAAVANGDASFDMSPGDQIRDFLPVEEAGRRIAQAARRGGNDGITNLCSGKPARVVDIVREWLRELDAAIELKTGVFPYPDYEPFAFWGDRRKLDGLSGDAP
jgi:dTDP-6-deoxy-L-talose 4-dehydrogenase (NAD+)